MITTAEKTLILKHFLELAQPLPVLYTGGKQLPTEPHILFERTGTESLLMGIGNKRIAERTSYTVHINTQTAMENILYAELIKRCTEGTSIEFVSESRWESTLSTNRYRADILLSLYTSEEDERLKEYTKEQLYAVLTQTNEVYHTVTNTYNILYDIANIELQLATGAETFSPDKVIQIKQDLLDKELLQNIVEPEINMTAVDVTKFMQMFLETHQPLPVIYGYGKRLQGEQEWLVYQNVGTSITQLGIGNRLIGEKVSFVVAIRTESAIRNMLYTDLLRTAVQESPVILVSEKVQTDGKGGVVNSFMFHIYNALHDYSAYLEERDLRALLQQIADRYILVTNRYEETIETSFIDKLILPEFEKPIYSYAEMLELKKKYLDKLLLTTTKY